MEIVGIDPDYPFLERVFIDMFAEAAFTQLRAHYPGDVYDMGTAKEVTAAEPGLIPVVVHTLGDSHCVS